MAWDLEAAEMQIIGLMCRAVEAVRLCLLLSVTREGYWMMPGQQLASSAATRQVVRLALVA